MPGAPLPSEEEEAAGAAPEATRARDRPGHAPTSRPKARADAQHGTRARLRRRHRTRAARYRGRRPPAPRAACWRSCWRRRRAAQPSWAAWATAAARAGGASRIRRWAAWREAREGGSERAEGRGRGGGRHPSTQKRGGRRGREGREGGEGGSEGGSGEAREGSAAVCVGGGDAHLVQPLELVLVAVRAALELVVLGLMTPRCARRGSTPSWCAQSWPRRRRRHEAGPARRSCRRARMTSPPGIGLLVPAEGSNAAHR